MVPSVWYIWRMVVNGSSQDGGCGKTREREKRAAKGWIERRWTVGRWRDEREDSITRHRQPRAYLVAIGFSLPKASSALYRIVHSASPRETHQDRTSFWNSVSWLSGWRWTSSYCLGNSDRTRIRDASKFLVQLLTQWLFEKKICRRNVQSLYLFLSLFAYCIVWGRFKKYLQPLLLRFSVLYGPLILGK